MKVRKISICLGLLFIFGIGNFAMAEAKEGNKGQNNEVKKSTITKHMRIKFVEGKGFQFISKEKKVTKTLPYKTWKEKRHITISPNGKYLIKKDDVSKQIKSDGKNIKIEKMARISYVNAFGKTMWKKEFKVKAFLDDLTDLMPYFIRISENGERILFVRTDKADYDSSGFNIDLFVLDKYGTQISSAANIPFPQEGPSDFEISRDGSIVAAILCIPDKNWDGCRRHLFFLDVETGKTKIVKAEGKNDRKEWGARFVLSKFINPKLPPSSEVYIGIGETYIGKHKRLRGWGGFLKFSEIPEDLSILLVQDKKK